MPRVIIDKECFKEAVEKLEKKRVLSKDNDDYYYLNYFDSTSALELIRGTCVTLINKNCKYHPTVKDEFKIQQRARTIEKYLWILMKFNEGCEANSSDGSKITYNLSINARLLKTEVSCK